MDTNTKILLLAVIVGIAVFAAIMWWPQNISNPFSEGTTVEMGNKAYEPRSLRIRQGERVTFINKDNAEDYWPASNIHPTHEIYSEFDPQKPIPPGGSWSFTFDRKGEWRYHDHLFPEVAGTIVVE